MTQADNEAKRLGRRAAEPEDILLALTGQASYVAAKVLSDLGADPQAIRARLEQLGMAWRPGGTRSPFANDGGRPRPGEGRACGPP